MDKLTIEITAIRQEKRLKQIDISEKLKIEQSRYSRLEKRGKKLTLEQIESICDALNVTPIDIFNRVYKSDQKTTNEQTIKLRSYFQLCIADLRNNVAYLEEIKLVVGMGEMSLESIKNSPFAKRQAEKIKQFEKENNKEYPFQKPKSFSEDLQKQIDSINAKISNYEYLLSTI